MSNHIGTLIPRVSAEIDKHSNKILLAKLDIGLAQFKILLTLLSHDGIKQVEIADKLLQTEPSISRQIKLLAKKSYVSVRSSKTSKRDKLVFLTNDGIEIAENAVNLLNDYHQPMFDILGEEKQNELRRILLTMSEYLRRD